MRLNGGLSFCIWPDFQIFLKKKNCNLKCVSTRYLNNGFKFTKILKSAISMEPFSELKLIILSLCLIILTFFFFLSEFRVYILFIFCSSFVSPNFEIRSCNSPFIFCNSEIISQISDIIPWNSEFIIFTFWVYILKISFFFPPQFWVYRILHVLQFWVLYFIILSLYLVILTLYLTIQILAQKCEKNVWIVRYQQYREKKKV